MPATEQLELPPFQGGLNIALKPHEIDDTQAVKLQDILLDQPGFWRRRGPIKAAASTPTFTYKISLAAWTRRPGDGAIRAMVAQTDDSSTGLYSYLASDFATVNASSANYDPGASLPTLKTTYPSTWAHLPNNRGAILCYATAYATDVAAGAGTVVYGGGYIWKGGNLAGGNDATGTITATRGSRTVTAAATPDAAKCGAGMFLWADPSDVAGTDKQLIGVVASVSGLTITLEEPALCSVAAGAQPHYTALRKTIRRVAKGTITASTASTTVNGGDTKFQRLGMGSGTYRIYRARDRAFVGDVNTVTSDIQLTLAANAAVACDNEPFIAIQVESQSYVGPEFGWIPAFYAGRQWWLNYPRAENSEGTDERAYWASPLDPEAVDTDEADGDWVRITSSTGRREPILGAQGTYAGLLIFKESETLVITGNTEATFAIETLWPHDGALGIRAIVPWQGGCLWAGKKGVYFWDGTAVNVLSESLGDGYAAQYVQWDPESNQAWAFVHRNHLLLHTSTGTYRTWVLNLYTGAWTTFTNYYFGSSIEMPGSTGKNRWVVVNQNSDVGKLTDAEDVFNSTGDDDVTSKSATAGPTMVVETKRYDAGQPTLTKKWHTLFFKALNAGGALTIEAIPGIETTTAYESVDSPVAADTDTTPLRRVRLFKRNTHLGLKFTEDDTSMTNFKMAYMRLSWAPFRPSRRGSGGGMV